MSTPWARLLALVASLFLFAALASAQTEPWSQEKATALAGELEQAVSCLRDAIRKSPNSEIAQQRKTLNRIQHGTRHHIWKINGARLARQLCSLARFIEARPRSRICESSIQIKFSRIDFNELA